MPEAAITLNGRVYRLACGEGEELRLQKLLQAVSEKLAKLTAEYGQAGEDRLFLMAAVLIADDMLEAREKAEKLERLVETAKARTREQSG